MLDLQSIGLGLNQLPDSAAFWLFFQPLQGVHALCLLPRGVLCLHCVVLVLGKLFLQDTASSDASSSQRVGQTLVL